MSGKVLVIEDDPIAAQELMTALTAAGYGVAMAVDSVQALPTARREQPDLILLDLTLPGGGGLQLLERLRSNAMTAATPVVVMAQPHDWPDDSLRAGAQAVLVKPVRTPALIAAVVEHVRAMGTFAPAPPAVLQDPARLRALRRLAVLDTPPEEMIDRFTRLAARILHVPVSLVSLVDEDRQFLKSQTGLVEPLASVRQTPLSHSFCQFAVSLRAPLVIENAHTHPVSASNLAVETGQVVAYAGVPLITFDDQAVGSLCAIDIQPRSWSDDDIAILRDLAAILVTQLELRQGL